MDREHGSVGPLGPLWDQAGFWIIFLEMGFSRSQSVVTRHLGIFLLRCSAPLSPILFETRIRCATCIRKEGRRVTGADAVGCAASDR